MCFVALASASPVPQLGYPAIGSPYGLGYGAVHASPLLHAAPVLHAPVLHAPVLHAPVHVKHVVAEPVDPNPQYSFSYGVSDAHTGDNKHQEETLVNGVVHGSYSLQEPDGTIRKVTYTADKINGFNAVVEKSGVAHHVAPVAKVIGPAIAHGPILAPHPAYLGGGLHGIYH